MAGLFDLIKGLNTGISSGVGAVASAPKKAVQAVSSPQGSQVIANLTKIALEKKRKEDEAKAKVQAVINAQIKGKYTGPMTNQDFVDPKDIIPANLTTGLPMNAEEMKARQREKDLNIIKGQNNPKNPIDNLLNTLLKTQLANRVAVGPVANFMRERQASSEKQATRPTTSFMDRVGDVAKTAGDVAGLAFNALPPVATYNATAGLGDMSSVTRPVVNAADAVTSGFAGMVNAIPQAGLNALPLSDSVKQDLSSPLSVITNLVALKAGSKIGEKVQVRINDAGYRAGLMESMNKNLAREGTKFNSGADFSPIIKAFVDAEKKLVKNPVIQALDPTGITTGLGATSKATAPKQQDDWLTQDMIDEVKPKVTSFDESLNRTATEVSLSEAGRRNVIPSETGENTVSAQPSTFPQWLPSEYRNKKLLNKALEYVDDKLTFPPDSMPRIKNIVREIYNQAASKGDGKITVQDVTNAFEGKKTTQTVPPKAKASMGGEVKAGLPEPVYAGNVKMKNIGSSDDARALINLGAQRLKAEGGDGYKEVVPLAQVKQETKDLSERTGINKETLEQWAKESVENRVRITAAREAMSSYAEDVAALSMKSRNEPDNMALKQELADKVRSMQEIQAATSTIIAESGRTLGANRIKTLEGDAIRIQEYIKQNQGKDPGAIADFLQSVPAKDLPEAIKKLTVPSFLDRIMTVRQAALLTDPRTSARNILGNMLGSGLRVVQKPFDIIADKIISGFNKSETSRSLTELLPGNKYKKMISKETMNKYLEKYASESGKFDNTPLKKTFIEKGADKVFEFLEAQDKIFKRMIGKDSIVASARTQVASEKLTGQAYKARMEELVKNPTDDMLRSMANEAIKWTYQNKPNSKLYDAVSYARNNVPVVGKVAVPFLRTIWNLASMSIERTVPGQALNLYKLGRGKISGKQALSSLLLTAAIQGAVSAAVESGGITGTERDPKKRAIREAEGIKDDVINTPFGSFSYKNIEPISTILGTAVDVHNTTKDVLFGEKNVVEGVGSVGISMADRFANNSFLRGVKDILDLVPGYDQLSGRNPEEKSVNGGLDYVQQQLATFYPRAFNWLEEISNEARSQRPEGFLESIMASTPGLSKGIPTRVDIWGQDVKKQDVTGNSGINTVLAALVPIQIEKQRNDPVNKEILRLKYYPSVPTQTIDGVSLSNKEYETYAREAGALAKTRLDALIQDPIYQRKSDADKIRAIESTISGARAEAKKSLGNLLDAGQRENLKGKNAKEVEDAAKKVFKETLTPAPKPKTVSQIKTGAKTAATTAAKGAQKVQSINNMIDVISEQLPQRTEQEILGILTTKTGGKFSEEEILFAIDMAKTGQKMSTTNPQDATQEYLQKNLPK